ncbi:Hint domain-containing protein [Aestuariibius sp. 2305UL40-4]|uniref:Hint domain-containing protein n=1 Tax=Aestuariibius violaceus TaxID=3234132 RepID=UPI00345E48DF
MATFNETIDSPGSFNFAFPANGEDNTLIATVDLPPDVNSLTFDIQSAQNVLLDDGNIETVVLNVPPGFTITQTSSQTFGTEDPPLQLNTYLIANEDGVIVGTGQIAANDITINEDFIICFTPGTLIRCAGGSLRPVEALKPGDMVDTFDNGPCRVRDVARSVLSEQLVSRMPKYTPIHFDAGAIGNTRAFAVSPQHRILLRGHEFEMLFAEEEVLVPAHLLQNGSSIRRATIDGPVEYIHLLLDTHEIVCSDGIWSETLVPGCQAMLFAGGLAMIEDFADELPSARPSLKGWEGRLIGQHYTEHLPAMAAAAPAPVMPELAVA